jgi:hypothetical protein
MRVARPGPVTAPLAWPEPAAAGIGPREWRTHGLDEPTTLMGWITHTATG